MRLPTGVYVERNGRKYAVVKLVKALYGLKQSPQLWNKMLTEFLERECGMTRGKSETSLYYKHEQGKYIILMTEVDDLIFTGDEQQIEQFEKTLKLRWNIKQCERLSSFLGINIHYDPKEGWLSFDVAEKVRKIFEERPIFQTIKPSNTPFLTDKDKWLQSELKSEGDEVRKLLMDPKVYASVIGAAIYISITCRPDITHAVGRLSRHMHNPDITHAAQARRLLGYLRKTPRHKLVYRRDCQLLKTNMLEKYMEIDSSISTLLCDDDRDPRDPIRGDECFVEVDADYAKFLHIHVQIDRVLRIDIEAEC